MDAEQLYMALRDRAEELGGFIDDSADEHLADAARIIAEDPRNEED